MTFEESKKLLKKEFMVISFHKTTEPFEFDESRWFKHEKPSVLEAFRVLAKEGYYTTISLADYEEREARYKVYNDVVAQDLLKAASQFNDALLDEQTKKIKKQDGEITRLLSLVEKKENSISRLYYEKSVLEKENEELKKGEIPAKYFDKALVDEQAEKIKKLEHEKLDILEMASSCKQTVTQRGKEIARLNGIIHDKNAVLSDVAEELRLSKIREKNLTEVCQKYMKENEELKNELDVAKKQNAAKMVDMTAKCFRAARESINDVFESYAAKYAKNTLDELKEKAYESFNAKACKLGLAGSKDGNGILDQMVWVDKAEEGGDHSAIIAQCCKNIAISKEEAKIIERCTKNGTELHYSEKVDLPTQICMVKKCLLDVFVAYFMYLLMRKPKI